MSRQRAVLNAWESTGIFVKIFMSMVLPQQLNQNFWDEGFITENFKLTPQAILRYVEVKEDCYNPLFIFKVYLVWELRQKCQRKILDTLQNAFLVVSMTL
jgi:hypothetical protein